MRFRHGLFFLLFCSFLLTASAQVQFFPPLQQTIFVIEGSPEGRVFMDVGILLVDRNSGILWQKRTTRTVNTGWVEVGTGTGGGSALSFSSQFTVTGSTNIALSPGDAELNLGTTANGGTATLVLATNLYRAIFSGATATIALPVIAGTTNGYRLEVAGTNTSGGSQVITFPALIRDEFDSDTPITTITNNTGAAFRMAFTSVAGVWRNVDASGDALSFVSTFSATSTDTLTGKTFDASATGNVLKLKNYLKFNFPRRVDGSGCTIPNTNDFTLSTFMVPRFSGTVVTNNNFCRFAIRVPKDLDTAVVPLASLSVRLTAADTAAQIYNVGFASVANSAVSQATVGTWIKLDVAADASGASDDVESVANVSLTGWTPTPGQWWVIELNRAGAVDASTVASELLELEIEYGATQ